ncbi:glutamine--tRNA ligase/YqeY domain fusion protein [Ignatzschineria cameli]|uniref:Glutamine--tRNA ligase n=1 Tax=Ignatzschineria cameli TaxID=2182793 RepID=A0A2U2AKV3_9GAMM|nr:glutamine--tRNA ligase/YqeY domain fusion protein [Ignatzschineria cameli]PWD83795.1 glutamine--tRNA ligase [Ignatzschineria cameli]PWD88309.1 glutamine--tRNA ligase [Ignatzschineria cameli]PWD88706.1 glutamine--tRNA ligase [Ignatzschineria cameli]PWD89232.1 glutamine--tRNA ligase [Ignatzschineria cameli]
MSENIVRTNFIRQIIDKDLESGKYQRPSDIHTRFPPEPNGYLHIGHAKSICLNFGIARDYGGRCNLRFDDTNPTKEEIEYVEAIKKDVEWLGFKWDDLFYASDYFEKFYEAAVHLIKKGLAYVDDSSAEEIRQMRGTLTEPGINSPYRERSIEENLDLFARMRAGEFEDGAKVLRAKIDMASPNMNLRDPALYRIRHETHHQTGDQWCIYPMYDFAHALSDAIEGITHSICTLEFEDHRPLYDWCVENADMPHTPRQYEFSRLNIEYNVMSKRLLTQLVATGIVDGWNDPRMPTISGLRRRGCPPEALHLFCDRIGVTKSENMIELQQLSQSMRDVLNEMADRRMAVLDPLKVTLTNLSDDEQLEIANHPQNESRGTRTVNFSNTLYIDRADFKEEANKKYKRLVLDGYVRLRGAYIIKATDVIKDDNGEINEIIAEIVPGTLGKNVEGVKARGVIQWVSAKDAIDITIHNYDVLFTEKNPQGMPGDMLDYLNKDSLTIVHGKGEPALAEAPIEQAYQFERIGYYARDSKAEGLVFNRVVELKDSFGE